MTGFYTNCRVWIRRSKIQRPTRFLEGVRRPKSFLDIKTDKKVEKLEVKWGTKRMSALSPGLLILLASPDGL